MLEPSSRTTLLEHLRPPSGSRLDVAVATTFTLDLDALLLAQLALAGFNLEDLDNKVALHVALQKVRYKTTVFYHQGKARVPRQPNELYALMDRVAYEVKAPRQGAYFHPKLWLLRFCDEETKVYRTRLVLPTRNLTNDTSWDAVLRLDSAGEPSGKLEPVNKPLADLVAWCLEHTVGHLHQRYRQNIDGAGGLIDSIRRTQWETPQNVNDLLFHVLGLPKVRTAQSGEVYRGRRHLVISPFISRAGLEMVAPSDDVTVLARADQFDQLDPGVLGDLDARVLAFASDGETVEGNHPTDEGEDPKDDATLNEISSAEDGTELGRHRLHAKIVVVEHGRQARFFVGSANASDNAYHGNIEVLAELRGGKQALGINALLKDLENVVVPYAGSGGEEESESARLNRQANQLLEEILSDDPSFKLVCTASPLAASKSEKTWTVKLSSRRKLTVRNKGGADVTLTIEPQMLPEERREVALWAPVEAEFTNIPLEGLSPWLVLRLTLRDGDQSVEIAALVKARLDGVPKNYAAELLGRLLGVDGNLVSWMLFFADPTRATPLHRPTDPRTLVELSPTHGSTPFSAGDFERLVQALPQIKDASALNALEEQLKRLGTRDDLEDPLRGLVLVFAQAIRELQAWKR